MKITMSLGDLKRLLDKQIKLTAEKLKSQSARYNKDSTDSQQWSLKIDEEKFYKIARETKYVSDFEILEKYLS